ncbi:FG-GAP-like repeat-containing protein [Streptomyces sp. NPDC101118]|uniref:FG-GAP-like repeat-containing protein n=1 Tax=Streptomyces sp. NPDC101118 TaxID=3366109 RepID=UPI00382CFA2B
MRMRREWAALAVAVAAVAGSVVAAGPASAASASGVHKADFNGDGYNDLVISAPAATVGAKSGAGYVAVVPGGANGPVTAQRKVISQATEGVPGDPGNEDWFGYSLATGDFNADGFSDLAVGAPYDRTGTVALNQAPGSVTVLYGSPAGLVKAARIMGTAKQLGLAVTAADMDGNGRPEVVASEYRLYPEGGLRRFTVARGGTSLTRTADYTTFGVYGLAAGDVDGDGRDEVVAQYTSTGGLQDVGVFHGGKLADNSAWWPESPGEGGADAAVGDIDKDGKADIVIGRPKAPWYAPGGDVAIWKGRTGGIADEPDRVITQATAGVPGTAEDGDGFGTSVALGDLDGDGHLDLAVGAGREDNGTAVDGGSVTVLRGSATGIVTATGGVVLTQNSTGVPGTTEARDQFGSAVSLMDFTKDGKAELTVSSHGEDNGAAEWPYYGDGVVNVLRGTATGVGTTGGLSLRAATFGSTPGGSPFGWAIGR